MSARLAHDLWVNWTDEFHRRLLYYSGGTINGYIRISTRPFFLNDEKMIATSRMPASVEFSIS